MKPLLFIFTVIQLIEKSIMHFSVYLLYLTINEAKSRACVQRFNYRGINHNTVYNRKKQSVTLRHDFGLHEGMY